MLALAQECGLRVARHRIETVADKGVLLVQQKHTTDRPEYKSFTGRVASDSSQQASLQRRFRVG